MEEWSAFHQSSHFKANPSGPISILAQLSLLKPLMGGAGLPPWALNLRFCWFWKAIPFFVMKLAWKNDGRHSTKICIFWKEQVAPFLYWCSQLRRSQQLQPCLPSLAVKFKISFAFEDGLVKWSKKIVDDRDWIISTQLVKTDYY